MIINRKVINKISNNSHSICSTYCKIYQFSNNHKEDLHISYSLKIIMHNSSSY